MKREPFDSNSPFDQLAELAKREIADAGLRIMEASQAYDLPEGDRSQATFAGVFTGLCGFAQAHVVNTTHAHHELLKVLTEYLPWAFDQARSCNNLPPLTAAGKRSKGAKP